MVFASARRPSLVAGLALTLGLGGGASSAAEGAPPAAPPGGEATGSLTVRVNQLRNARGRVAVALFASASGFPDQKRAIAGKVVPITNGRAAARFDGLRPGVYAAAVLHDENQNDQMDFNFLGMPLEGYGFSNDASALFGPPSFEAAAFTLRPRPSFITVATRYFP